MEKTLKEKTQDDIDAALEFYEEEHVTMSESLKTSIDEYRANPTDINAEKVQAELFSSTLKIFQNIITDICN